MKTFVKALLLLSAVTATTGSFAADEIAVIVNRANTQQLTMEQVKNIYSDNINAWQSGARIRVLNAPVNSYIREIFSKKVLGLSAHQAAATEANKKITNSLKNPSETKRERLVASIVSKKTNAIGYVSKEMAESKSGVKIIMIIKE